MHVPTGRRWASSSLASCWICSSTWGGGGQGKLKGSTAGAGPGLTRVLPPPVLFSPALLDEGPQILAPPGLAPATYAGCWLVAGMTWRRGHLWAGSWRSLQGAPEEACWLIRCRERIASDLLSSSANRRGARVKLLFLPLAGGPVFFTEVSGSCCLSTVPRTLGVTELRPTLSVPR